MERKGEGERRRKRGVREIGKGRGKERTGKGVKREREKWNKEMRKRKRKGGREEGEEGREKLRKEGRKTSGNGGLERKKGSLRNGFCGTKRCHASFQRGNNQQSYSAATPMNHTDDHQQCCSGGMHTLVYTNSSLFGRKAAPQDGYHTWFWKPSLLFSARRVYNP